MQLIERKEYLDWLIRWQEQQIIKVVSGVRRCGKSTMFDIFKEHLIRQGVHPNQIITLNFEDIKYEALSDYRLLYDYIKPRLLSEQMNYIFLDEYSMSNSLKKLSIVCSLRKTAMYISQAPTLTLCQVS